ncbi:MAG: MerR family transcriptional regulator [Bdellovibrionales bacterium]|nr:MerR family transcriptional regulator [Bdellovibrionales bacterium]
MSDELVFDAFNEHRYAPSLKDFTNNLFDPELEKEIKTIPDKLAFKIGEVAEICDLKAYVLRYWETEFDQLRPQKSSKNQRVYLKRDVEMVMMIKKLLYRDRFSIEGARVALKQLKRDSKQVRAVGGALDKVDSIRQDIEELVLHISSLKKLFS